MENCSRLNIGIVSHIQFILGTEVDHPSGTTCLNIRSKVKVTRSCNVFKQKA